MFRTILTFSVVASGTILIFDCAKQEQKIENKTENLWAVVKV